MTDTNQIGNSIMHRYSDIGCGAQAEIVSTYPHGSSCDLTRRSRVSELITLFDGRILNAEDNLKWDTKGTGTATFIDNSINMAVAPGQYLIRQSRLYCPYFSGKPQLIEATHINFKAENGVIKRVGYFSSAATAPYSTAYDGVYLEASNNTYYLVCVNMGNIVHSVEINQWSNYSAVKNLDWSKFNVIEIDFLWLGGAGLRLFVVVDGEFILAHTINNHAGYQTALIMKSPNQPVRYEIRSTGGSGSMYSVCSIVGTEGGKHEQGQGVTIVNTGRDANIVGTPYLLCAARKSTSFRDHFISLDYVSCAISGATSDAGILYLCLNPTYSTTPTWVSNSRIEEAVSSNITITSLGKVLRAIPLVSSTVTVPAPQASLRNLLIGIDNVRGELALVYSPLTQNQTICGSMMFLEY